SSPRGKAWTRIQSPQRTAMRLYRIQLRTLMLAISLIGLATWGLEIRHRSALYRVRASWHAQEKQLCERTFAQVVRCSTSMGTDRDGQDIRDRVLVDWRKRMDYHSQMKKKYEYAGAHPWEMVAP